MQRPLDLRRLVPLGGFRAFGSLTKYPLVFDSFTDANGTAITAHTPNISPAAWGNTAGAFNIQSNQANVASLAGGLALASIDTGVADCTIEAACVIKSGGQSSIAFRVQDSTNFWSANLKDDATTGLRLLLFTGGAPVLNESVNMTITAGQTYALKVVLLGSQIDIYVDGALVKQKTNATGATRTKHGIYAQATATRFDNFQITR